MQNTSFAFLLLFCLIISLIVTPLPVNAQVANTWETKAPMPTARSGFGIAEVNGSLYVIGGYNKEQTDFSNVNEVYNPTTDTWVTKAPMPTHRVSFGIAVYQNKIYVFGGQILVNGNRQVVNTTEVYDPSSDSWAAKAPMPHLGEDFAANVVVGDKIYVISTYNDIYDPKEDSWTTKAAIPEPVAHSANAVVDSKIYVITGTHYGNEPQYYVPINATQIYDPTTDSWSSGASIPTGVASPAAVATTGIDAPKAIYVIGGLTLTPNNDIIIYGPQTLTQVYYPENDSWSLGASMPTARYALAVGILNDKLYAMGGSDDRTTSDLANNEAYVPMGYGSVTKQGLPVEVTVVSAVAILVILAVVGIIVWNRRRKSKP